MSEDTMLDKCLVQWRAYQQNKKWTKMAALMEKKHKNNRGLPVFVSTSTEGDMRLKAELVVVNNEVERHLHFVCRILPKCSFKILAENLRGYEQPSDRPNVIILKQVEHLHQHPMELYFSKARTTQAAIAAIDALLSKRLNFIQTSPCNKSSSSRPK